MTVCPMICALLIQIGASLMYLRGVIHMNQNNFDRAKEFFLRAVQVDARCYQAYDQLIANSLLDPDEGSKSIVVH
jgi:anaphase-promoting complex subunit 6